MTRRLGRRIPKRLFDIVASSAGLLLLLPFGIVVVIIVKIVSPGPVWFAQRRVGQWGRLFTCIKLRTMTIDSEHAGTITALNDSRITPIGKVLRRYKLDELPQLYNVLTGTMSLVGPRPDVPGYADVLTGENRKILELKPGITGPASLYFRKEEELLSRVADPKLYNDTVIWPKKVAINLFYLECGSFFKDVGYILITLFPSLDRCFGLMRELEKRCPELLE